MTYKMKGFSGFKNSPAKQKETTSKLDYKIGSDTLDRMKTAEQAKAKEGQAVSEAIDEATGRVSDTAKAKAEGDQESPNKFLGKFMRNTGVGRGLGKAAKFGAFGPVGMLAAGAAGAYKKKGGGTKPHGDEAHTSGQPKAEAQGAAEQVAEKQAAVQGEIPTDAPAVTGTPQEAPMMKKGSPRKQDDVEHKDLWVPEEGQGPRKTPVGPISDIEKRKVRERIADLEDRIEFISQDVDNDRVDRDKGFKRIRQFEAKIDELNKAIK